MLASAFVAALAAASTSEPPAILITRQLAEAERLAVGDVVSLSSVNGIVSLLGGRSWVNTGVRQEVTG